MQVVFNYLVSRGLFYPHKVVKPLIFLHYLNKREDFDRFYLQQGVLDYLKEEKARGRIRNLGFSYHGDVPFFEYLMDNFSWDCTLIQLNYQDWNEETETPEGTRIMGSLYRKAAEKGVPCFVMEPVRGGRLASLPESAEKLLKEREPNRSIASWAIRFAASQPEVVTVLSGMSDLNQVVDNINTLSDFKPLSKTDQMELQKANGNAVALQAVACTYCRYCMPCPYGVDIPGNFKVYNDWAASLGFLDEDRKPSEKQKAEFLRHYRNSIEKPARADHCIHCRKCLELCPQHGVERPELAARRHRGMTWRPRARRFSRPCRGRRSAGAARRSRARSRRH